MNARVLTAEFAHETNTFSRIATDEQAFRDCYYLPGAEAIAERGERNTSLAGFLEAGNRYGWQIDHVLSASAGPSGKVTNAAFDWLTEPIIDAARNGRYEAILLGLHGAMVSESHDDGGGGIAARLAHGYWRYDSHRHYPRPAR